jgi:outer membrane immunogenic protein
MRRWAFAVVLSACPGFAALAADLPPPAPPAYIPVLPYNWSGFYLGGNVGAGWGWSNFTDPLGNGFSTNSTTQIAGGGQIGANYEFWGGTTIGVEADFDWLANTDTSSTTALGGVLPVSVVANNRWLTTVTGRIGYALDRVLVYGKGGGAWVGASNPTIIVAGTSLAAATSGSNWGWTAGVGVEWAFWGTWSVRAEYDYVGLTNQSFTVPATAPALAGDVFTGNSRNIQLLTAGINYKFGPW